MEWKHQVSYIANTIIEAIGYILDTARTEYHDYYVSGYLH